MKHLLILLSLLFLTFPSAVYSAQNRVALVIGNGAYRNYPLRNPVNDARLMRNLLRKAGFSVTIVENARKNEMVNAIRSFGRSLRNSDAALFYFSGHGNQYKGLNWLIPIGAKIQRESEIEFEGLNAERVLAEMEGGSSGRVNIVIFDACRVNRTFRSFRSYNSGLAYPKVQPEGSIVAYSTAPGTIAYDGDGRNSPYVSELKKYLLTPGLKIEDVFKRVRVGVKNRTARKPSPQIPWENSALMGDFYFILPSYQTSDSTQTSNYSADQEAWSDIKNSSDPEDFIAFIDLFPNSPLAKTAKFKLSRMKKKQTFQNELSEGVLYAYRVDNEYGWHKDRSGWKKGNGGMIYEGEIRGGKANGRGRSESFDGSVTYEGEWKNGKRHGIGRSDFGLVKIGEWEQGQFIKGTIYSEGGSKSWGEWKKGSLMKPWNVDYFNGSYVYHKIRNGIDLGYFPMYSESARSRWDAIKLMPQKY